MTPRCGSPRSGKRRREDFWGCEWTASGLPISWLITIPSRFATAPASGGGDRSLHYVTYELKDLNNMSTTITRKDYAGMFGPTAGDRVRLGDTDLIIEVERDCTTYGNELKFGGGKSFRDSMGQSSVQLDAESPDTIITNALIVDYTGIYKADIGIKDGKISAIGRAGNPQTMDGVTPGLEAGSGTEAIAGEGLIVTAGGLDPPTSTSSPRSRSAPPSSAA